MKRIGSIIIWMFICTIIGTIVLGGFGTVIGLVVGLLIGWVPSKGASNKNEHADIVQTTHSSNSYEAMDMRLIGRWVGYPGGDKIEILFNSDGSFDTNVPFAGGSETFGVWKDKEGELLLTLEAGHLGFIYLIDEDTLSLTNVKTGVSMDLAKA